MEFEHEYKNQYKHKYNTRNKRKYDNRIKNIASFNGDSSQRRNRSNRSNTYSTLSSIDSVSKQLSKKSKKRTKHKSNRSKISQRSSKSHSSSKSSSTSRSEKLSYTDYEVLETVGSGSFAKVSRVRRKSTKEILVWKELDYGTMGNKEKQMLCDEVNILRDLNHPNIVQFVDRVIDHQKRKIYIVQEYCDGGDLASYIKTKRDKIPKMSGRISETFIWSVTSEIASALQHCHSHFSRHQRKTRILHRDLKPGNVFLVKRRGTYSVKIGDFGLAKMLDESSCFAQTHVGTPYYMSPEQIQSKSYNEKSDIWSLGCIVYEMAMLSPPFKASNYLHLAEKIQSGIYNKISSRNYSKELESAISMMLTVDFSQRAKVEELLCLPRIQFTSKMLRLDRRYCQLKKKEQQFNLKMMEYENKYKKRSLQLLEKENALKLKESQLNHKEAMLSSKRSLSSNNSSTANIFEIPESPDSNLNILSPITTESKSDNTTFVEMKTDRSSVHSLRSYSFNASGDATNGIPEHESLNTSGTATSSIPETNSIRDRVHTQHEEEKEKSPIVSSNINIINSNKKQKDIIIDHNIINDARNFLMERINLSDLNDTNISNFSNTTNTTNTTNNTNNVISESLHFVTNKMHYMDINRHNKY